VTVEALAPPAEDVTWGPNPKQALFLEDFSAVDEVLYGGAAGGGKSDALLMFGLERRMRWPHSRGLMLRRTYPELEMEGGLIPRSHELYAGVGHWNGQKRRWTFKNRSVLQFGHLQHEEDKFKYRGSAWEDIGFDELTRFTLGQYLYVGFSRLRTVIPGCTPKVRGATNPGDEGHLWVRDRFIEHLPPLRVRWYERDAEGREVRVKDPEQHRFAKSRAFVPAKLEDNPYLFDSGHYEAGLAALPLDDFQALRHGDWYAWSGQVFKRWRYDRHVIEPRRLGPDVPRWAGLDWGYASPFVCLVLAAGDRLPSDPEPKRPCSKIHVYVTQEVTLRQKLDEEQRDHCLRVIDNPQRLVAWNADPASFFQHDNRTGLSPAEWWLQKRVVLTPSNNDRVQGKRAVDAMLNDCDCGVPWLRVFSTCTDLIRTLPSLGYDQTRVEDVAKSDLDHWVDALRYGIMGLTPMPANQAPGGDREVGGRHA
jgi:hypothetical protein